MPVALIALLSAAGPLPGGPAVQISVKAHVIQAPAGTLAKDLLPAKGGEEEGHPVQAFLSAAEAKALLADVKQRVAEGKLTLVAAPAVTSLSGQRALVEIVREFIYPTEYEAPQLPDGLDFEKHKEEDGAVGVFPVTPATPTAFETRNVGLKIEVMAETRPGGRIELEFGFEDSRFDGFVNYGSPIQAAVENRRGKKVEVVLTENRIEMPVFSVRKLASTVELEDGGWVFLGGMPDRDEPAMAKVIRNDDDQSGDGVAVEPRGPVFLLVNARIVDAEGN